MKKKLINFLFLLLIVGILAGVGHEVSRRIHSGESSETSTDAEIDRGKYYTYGDVENIIKYLSDTTAEEEALSRLIDPLKKSEIIDVQFVKDIANAIQVKDMVYVDVLKDKNDTDYVTKEEFERIYENIVAAAVVKGLIRTELLVLKLDDTDKTSFFDGHEIYHAEFPLKQSYEGSVIDVYIKKGKIFKVNGLGDSKITLTNVWVKSVEEGTCDFVYGAMEQTSNVRNDVQMEAGSVEVATSLDSKQTNDTEYKTEGYIADLVFDYAGICAINKKTQVLRASVRSSWEKELNIENIGELTLADDYKIYNVYDTVMNEESLAVLSGYKYVDLYLQDGQISAVVIDEKLESENIRVIINNDEYSSYEMEMVSVTSASAFTVVLPDGTEKKYGAGENVTFSPNAYTEGDVIQVAPDVYNGRIKLLSTTRECGNPEYGGMIELDIFSDYIYVINEVPLEDYLANVVANAMPQDYPDAALQAMAICARGTAYTKMKDESYAEYNAHLDDSSLCQVYNNVKETDSSIRAVKDTYGLVPVYEGNVIVPMTFNTSFGMTCTNAEIWGGEAYDYLKSNVENLEKTKLDLSDEETFESFLKDATEYNIIDKDSGYYRWEIAFSKEEMTDAVISVLNERKSLMEECVQIENEAGEFVTGEIPNIGTVENVEVAERTSSGVVSKLIIQGSEHTIAITGQSHVRAILSPEKQKIKKQDGSVITGWTSLPSPYYYVEKTNDGFIVYGGGFGHGAGMSIYGAGVLGRQRKNYKYILRQYFSYIDFASIYSMQDEVVENKDTE